MPANPSIFSAAWRRVSLAQSNASPAIEIVSTRHRVQRPRAPDSPHERHNMTCYNLGSPRVPIHLRAQSCPLPPSPPLLPPYPGYTYSPESLPVSAFPLTPSRYSTRHRLIAPSSQHSNTVNAALAALGNMPSSSTSAQNGNDIILMYGDRRIPTLRYEPPPPTYDDLYGPDPNKPVSKREVIIRIARRVGRELVGGNK